MPRRRVEGAGREPAQTRARRGTHALPPACARRPAFPASESPPEPRAVAAQSLAFAPAGCTAPSRRISMPVRAPSAHRGSASPRSPKPVFRASRASGRCPTCSNPRLRSSFPEARRLPDRQADSRAPGWQGFAASGKNLPHQPHCGKRAQLRLARLPDTLSERAVRLHRLAARYGPCSPSNSSITPATT